MEKPAAERKYHLFNILHEEDEEENRNSRIPCKNSRKKEEGTSSQGAVPREVMSFSSPFPFFWTSMKSFNFGVNFRMTIPIKFAREHLAAEVDVRPGGVDVLLKNEEGHSWEVLLKPAGLKSLRYMFCSGWKDFATENKLKIGDCVIFELIDRLPDSTFAMNFHICRIPVQESNRPEQECFTRLPSSPLAQERKRRGKACDSSTTRMGSSDNHEKFASAIAVESEGDAFSSPFPSFWITLKTSNVFRILIPIPFAREHLPTKCGEERMERVLLKNVEGRSWELRAGSNRCDKYYLGKGWKTFATDNKLNIGDCVLLELIGKLPNATYVMNFHIYRIPGFVEEDLDDE